MQTRSFLLDTESWDLTLDDSGNIAITDNPYSVAQDVACACSTYLVSAGMTQHWVFLITSEFWDIGRELS
ncbi:hypothetical protein [Photorhabdus viridis]|uniref:hypothetical protein n=1 Tax=Photorhabdus viridis TaxID=3163327 RepID=UPI0033077F3A